MRRNGRIPHRGNTLARRGKARNIKIYYDLSSGVSAEKEVVMAKDREAYGVVSLLGRVGWEVLRLRELAEWGVLLVLEQAE